MSELQKPFPKKSVQIFFQKKKLKIKVKMTHVNKEKLARKRKTRPRMNNGWIGKTI